MSYAKDIERHYRSHWGSPIGRERLKKGRIADLPHDYEVLVFSYSDNETAYGTVCMSQPSDAEPLELHFLTGRYRKYLVEPIEVLTIVAHYHRTACLLGHGHTVNLGYPWMRGSKCTHALITLPYLDGPKLEWSTDPRVRFLWLIPITEDERDYKIEYGLEALEQRFEETEFNYLDPDRPSVV